MRNEKKSIEDGNKLNKNFFGEKMSIILFSEVSPALKDFAKNIKKNDRFCQKKQEKSSKK